MAEKTPQLTKVPPRRIAIREMTGQPSIWDSRVIHSDMVKYISVTQVVNSTPLIEIRQKTIVAVSGIPFILAAIEANPPLETIVCACHCIPHQLREFGLQLVTATELLDEIQVSMPFDVTNMLFFDNPVERSKQLEIQDLLTVCFDRINETMADRRTNLLGDIEWQDGESILIWKWPYMVLEGSHAMMLPKLINHIDSSVAKIRSHNGMALTYDRPDRPV